MITTYAELKQAVADWMNRSDLDTKIPDFIANGEARLNTMVRHREMVDSATLTFDATGEATLPTGYLEWRALKLATTPVARPEYVEPDSREFMYRFRPYSVPQYFTIMHDTVFVQPATATTGTLYFYKKLDALTAQNTSNWLLARSPDCYLYAAVLEGHNYLRDMEGMEASAQMLRSAVDGLLDDGRRSRMEREPAPQPNLATKTQEQMQ